MTYRQDADQLTHPRYRPDIDGLRAIGVLSVVGYHVFPNWIGGGFVGVDIFFVISGYLISTIIFENLERGTFSFRVFYGRRIKRIFPALLTVLFASLVVGWWVLDIGELEKLGEQIAGGVVFYSNFLQWRDSGYFDAAALTKPMLHLWSLSIEEQFYVLWPLMLWLSWKNKSAVLVLTLSVLTASFAWNIWESGTDVVADFYSPLTRFYELLIGACLAYATLFNPTALQRLRGEKGNALSVTGILLIGAAFAFITSRSIFPGWWALLPTLGTALTIAAGRQAWLNRMILSHPVAVWFGLISFPLYLWHWPLLSFASTAITPFRGMRTAIVLLPSLSHG